MDPLSQFGFKLSQPCQRKYVLLIVSLEMWKAYLFLFNCHHTDKLKKKLELLFPGTTLKYFFNSLADLVEVINLLLDGGQCKILGLHTAFCIRLFLFRIYDQEAIEFKMPDKFGRNAIHIGMVRDSSLP